MRLRPSPPRPLETDGSRYDRYRRAIAGERLPVAIVDLDAFDRNVDRAVAKLADSGKTLRIATKSIRCPDLVALAQARAGSAARGVLAVSAPEAQSLVELGARDVLIGYPSAQSADADLVAKANATARVIAVADALEHVDLLDAAARRAGVTVPVVVDADVSLRALGGRVHLGARRSPLGDPDAVVDLARHVRDRAHLEFAGVLAYEAQVAGVSDGGPRASPVARAKNLVRHALEVDACDRRAAIARALDRAGLSPGLFNGGGSGSLGWSARDPSLSEVAVGSAFLGSHLFDSFFDLESEPAIAFALQVSRAPAPGFATCLGGGLVASGRAGVDRLPLPWLPAGLELTTMEGAGEVQTPLLVPRGQSLPLGAPVFFRPAKAGELAAHFKEYLLIRGDMTVGRAPTYRGLGIDLT